MLPADGWHRITSYNVCYTKLLRRYAVVEHNLEVLKEWLNELEGDFVIQAKQLYHDREEITVHVYDNQQLARRRSGAYS